MNRLHFFRMCVGLVIGHFSVLPATAQIAPVAKSQLVLPATASAKKADEFLATLKPPTSVQALASGNDLLFDVPDLAAAGQVRVKLTSTMPRTDGLWVLSLSPQPEAGVALLAAVSLGTSALPEVSMLLSLSQTQTLLFVARSGGKYYGTQREIKIGEPKVANKKP